MTSSAGIPCVIRRQPLGKSYIDRCITDDPDKKLPPELRNRTLTTFQPLADGKGVFSSTKVNKAVLNASVDSGVFAMPDGIKVKDLAVKGGH